MRKKLLPLPGYDNDTGKSFIGFLVGKLQCRFGRHDLKYFLPPEGIMGGIFAPCACRRLGCNYSHPGFPYPLDSPPKGNRSMFSLDSKTTVVDIIDEINTKILDIFDEGFEDYPYLLLEYSTDGFGEMIEFMGYPVWNSEESNFEVTETPKAFRKHLYNQMVVLLDAVKPILSLASKGAQG